MKEIVPILIAYLILISFSCRTTNKSNTTTNKEMPKEITLDFSGSEQTIVYKTKAENYNKVPVTLSKDKRRIIGYPHPKDVFYEGKLALPIRLEKGYFLDNRGINANTALLNITYSEYAKLPTAPKLMELEKMIIDKDPFYEICNCGNRNQFENEIEELNNIIETNNLSKCKKIK